MPAGAEFKKIVNSKSKSCSLVLSRVHDTDYSCIKNINSSSIIPQWENSFEFVFGELTQDEFEALRATYGEWHSYTPEYVEGKSYQLLDFFPPIIRALNNHMFLSQLGSYHDILPQFDDLQLASEKLLSNCWGTVYEILRHATSEFLSGVDIFYAPADQVRDLFREKSQIVRSERPGDILLILHTNGGLEYFDHVVLVLDDGIYFEKAGAGDSVPFRVVDRQTLESIWSPRVFAYELRRPNVDINWPAAEQIFSLKSSYTLVRFPEFVDLPNNISRKFTSSWSYDETGSVDFFRYLWIKKTDPLTIGADGKISLPATAYREEFFYLLD
jgi:hypothetical protein